MPKTLSRKTKGYIEATKKAKPAFDAMTIDKNNGESVTIDMNKLNALLATRKGFARIESISIAKKTEKSVGCTLKLTYSDKVPEGVSRFKEFKYPSNHGLLKLKADKGSTTLTLTNFDVTVNIADGIHTAICKPLNSFGMESLKFLYSHRLEADEGNEVEFEFVPAQREMFDDE